MRLPLSRKPLGRMKLLMVAFALLSVTAGAAEKVAPLPSVKDLAAAWVGYGSHGMAAYRLVLDANGTGALGSAATFGEQDPHSYYLYKVTRWSLSKRRILAEAVETYPGEASLHISGRVGDDTLDLQFKARWRNWLGNWYAGTYRVRLFPETSTLKTYELLGQIMKRQSSEERP
jgi:hypothetical protein